MSSKNEYIKNIFWRPGNSKNANGLLLANMHIIARYGDIHGMVKELKETFPEATDDTIRMGFVTGSRKMKGFPIIRWEAHISEGNYPGWDQYPYADMTYSW